MWMCWFRWSRHRWLWRQNKCLSWRRRLNTYNELLQRKWMKSKWRRLRWRWDLSNWKHLSWTDRGNLRRRKKHSRLVHVTLLCWYLNVVFRLWSFVLWHHLVWGSDTSVVEEHAAFIFRIQMNTTWCHRWEDHNLNEHLLNLKAVMLCFQKVRDPFLWALFLFGL